LLTWRGHPDAELVAAAHGLATATIFQAVRRLALSIDLVVVIACGCAQELQPMVGNASPILALDLIFCAFDLLVRMDQFNFQL
jgi:hypothetical protein